jgi:23S rRNA (adenine2503-C2)-methyltransferase
MPDPFGLTSEECLALARAAGWGPPAAVAAAYRVALAGGDPPAGLPAALAGRWRETFPGGLPAILERRTEDDPTGPTVKFVLALADDARVECVLLSLGRGRRALCCSSQVGCRFGCTFCATGRLGFRRDLSAAEMVGQVVAVARDTGTQPDHVTLMGMGEPLDNLAAVVQALRVLQDRRGPAYAQDRLTVCTVGLPAGIRALRELGWKRINLTVSLHAADDALRRRLLPSPRLPVLAELQAALAAYPQRRNFTLGVNYCLLPGVNDRPVDAAALAAFCAPLGRVLVHLIPVNPVPGRDQRAPTDAETAAFVERLRATGLPVRRRIVKGRDIAAACGMLGAGGGRR